MQKADCGTAPVVLGGTLNNQLICETCRTPNTTALSPDLAAVAAGNVPRFLRCGRRANWRGSLEQNTSSEIYSECRGRAAGHAEQEADMIPRVVESPFTWQSLAEMQMPPRVPNNTDDQEDDDEKEEEEDEKREPAVIREPDKDE